MAQMYRDIGQFNRDITLNVQEASDKGMYLPYWNNLVQLVETVYNSAEEQEIVNLEVYKLAIFDTLSAGYVDYSGFWGKCQWLSDSIYNFCTVDMVNWNVVTRTASDIAQRANSYIEAWTQDVEEWFKYGKYVVDIVASIAGAGLAIIGAVAAFLAIPFTGGSTAVVAVGLLGFAATSVSAVITIGNSATAITQDVRGMACLDENPGQARFYGTTESMSSFVAKNDLGSQEFNEMASEAAGVIDTVKAGADAVAVVTGGVSTLGTKTTVGLNGQKLYTFDFSRQNMTNNIWKTFGITRTQNTSVYNTTNSSVQVTQMIPDEVIGLNVMDDASLSLTAAQQNTYTATLSQL